MRIGPLLLFSRTSARRTFIVAGWHSSHSLTWRWSLCVRPHNIARPTPFAYRNSAGFGVGIGPLLSVTTHCTNDGRQWEVSAFWHGLHFSQQRPMWFRDIYRRERDREIERGALQPHAIIPSAPAADNQTIH